MPVDDRDERSTPSAPNTEEHAPTPTTPTEAAGGDAGASDSAPPPTGGTPPAAAAAARRRGLRRYVNRRNAMWTGIAAVSAVVILSIVVFILYRTGRVDSLIARQIVGTLAAYGIRAEIEGFETQVGARTAVLTNIKLYDATTGEQLGQVGRIAATVRIEDLYALNLRRNVNLEALEVDALEMWVKFDEEGRSNFRNIKLPPPDPNRRILFSYSTARVKLNGAVIHYDDQRHDLSGEARNVRATVQPDDPGQPAESWMNTVELALSDSTFVYDGRPVNNIGLEARARINQTRAEIQQIVLKSPVAEARLQGTMDDWRNLRYQMQVESNVDLTQISDVLRTETTLRGAGKFNGTVAGEGTRYQVNGQIQSDALAADNVRLKALNVNANVKGDGKNYEAQGRAVAELLSAGDFQLNAVQLAGGVMGTGTDFRWIGELRSASARAGKTTIAGLILRDATAELREGQIDGTVGSATLTAVAADGATVRGVEAANVRFKRAGTGATDASASSVRAATVVASGATVNNVAASGIEADISPNGAANVTVERVTVGALNAAGARTGTLNIAGVRLAVSEGGRIQGSSGDVNVGTVAFTTPAGRSAASQGRAENVRLARPVFSLEPNGRYRASADLSLGGGVLGQMRLGAARSAVVATNNEIQLTDFNAEIFGGRATGDATVNTGRGASRVAARFDGVDVGGLIAAVTGNVVPIAGAATGNVNLQFPGTNFEAASGTLDANFSGESGTEARGRTPLTGEVTLTANRGLFQVERANLRTGASQLNASGQFSFAGDSDLRINLASTDAAELQRVVLATGLAGDIEEKLNSFGVELAGNLDVDGTVRGSLDAPQFTGRAALASLTVRGRDLGALSADIASTASEVSITNGQLAERDGGGANFNATIPLVGENNIAFEATLERANAGNLVAALAGSGGDKSIVNPEQLAGIGPASGRISVTGFPGQMKGSADLRVAAGTIGGQPYEEIAARATLDGSTVNLESFDARLRAGRVAANGTFDTETTAFNFKTSGTDVPLDLITSVAGSRAGSIPALSGLANFTADATGTFADPRSYRITVDAQGRDVAVNGQPAGALTLTGRTTPDQKFELQLTTGIFGQPQVISARVDLSNEELPATFETTLTGTDLTPLFTALLGTDMRVTGRATGTLRGSGNLLGEEGFSALTGRAEFTELAVQIEDVQLAAENPLVVQFSPREIIFERTRFTGTGTNILFGGTTALAEGGRQNLSIDGDLNLRVLNNLSPDLFLSGQAKVGVRVTGSFAAPRLTGTAEVERASVSTLLNDERLTVERINGRVRFTADRAEIESLTGRLGGGTVNVSGGALLAGLRPSQVLLNVRASDVTVPFPNDFRSTADADLQIRGRGETLNALRISGAVNLRRTEYTQDIELADIINRRGEASITEAGGGGGGSGSGIRVQLDDLRVEGRDALVVRNNLADVVGSVSLNINGSADDPVVSGRIALSRGTLNFRNDRYEVTRAYVDLPARRDADPVLNIQAEAEIRGYRVIVGLTGPLSQPSTSVRSDPALPQADVVALITTGNLSTGDQSASTLAQSGFGTATSLLTDRLINAPVQRATDKLFGLNRFEIDPQLVGRGGASPTARLTVGRQINRNLSVTYSTNVTSDQNQVVAVEYRVSDRLSFVARYQQGAVNSLRGQNNEFNFEIRFRKRF